MDLVIYGAGGMAPQIAEAVLDTADDGADMALIGFIDDDQRLHGTEILGFPVLGGSDWLESRAGVGVVLGVGHPLLRHRISTTGTVQSRLVSIIHPDAWVSRHAVVGQGTVVMRQCIVSCRCQVGIASHLNYGVYMSHDATVGSWACVMAHSALSGGVRVGDGAFIGVGVSTRQGVCVGEWSLVGAGAAVVRAIPSFCVAAGVPASPIRHYSSPQQMPPF